MLIENMLIENFHHGMKCLHAFFPLLSFQYEISSLSYQQR